MRTRIALVAVFTVASIIAISTAVLVRPVTSQAAATAPSKSSSTSTSSITNASQLVAFNTSKSRPATIAGLGASLSLVTGLVAAADTAATTPVAATPAPAVVAVQVAAPAPVPVSDATSTATGNWDCIRVRESGDRYNDPSAPSGAYGIISVTWNSYGYSGWPYEASPAIQDALALKLYNQYGWQPWSSRYACGL